MFAKYKRMPTRSPSGEDSFSIDNTTFLCL
jgi:hypothetical protein